MNIIKLHQTFGRSSENLLSNAAHPHLEGAMAAIETFYHAFNNRDLALFSKIWLPHPLIQLNNPLGGMIRGIDPINSLYEKIFNGQARVWVELKDIVCYESPEMVVFAGQENGEFTIHGETIDLKIRTTRFFGFYQADNQWFQVHHHGSIDQVALLDQYQKAVK